ncbi:DUF2493 domain-containing protein [Sulfurovum sp. NBC37-1]|uniref:DUF2493 domain-containing protein n=1 Tax=Sulfurovum sp. (strain NBC37-1) TaxID=387093 RepID=UPI0001587981|nr:DUF2493 domain-containing protein [Sulfurovum sp. NBC37-1]BAF73240.1 conserved hypothetical protein [Sulfurovum sp. NBC37-1]
MENITKVAVVGSRGFEDYVLFKTVMDKFLADFESVAFVSGGASGADSLAERYAKEHGIEVIVFKPEWKRYGKRAGYMRNAQIWKEADVGIAFWDGESKGTRHSFKLAKKMSKELRVFDYLKRMFIDPDA